MVQESRSIGGKTLGSAQLGPAARFAPCWYIFPAFTQAPVARGIRRTISSMMRPISRLTKDILRCVYAVSCCSY